MDDSALFGGDEVGTGGFDFHQKRELTLVSTRKDEVSDDERGGGETTKTHGTCFASGNMVRKT